MNIGEVHDTNYWGKVVVVEVLGKRDVVVKFLNTGNVKTTRADYLLRGSVKDVQAQSEGVKITGKVRKLFPIPVGTVCKSNYYGDMEVIEFKCSKNVLVKFVNTGNLEWTQRVMIDKGQVQDSVYRDNLRTEKDAAIKATSALFQENRVATKLRNEEAKAGKEQSRIDENTRLIEEAKQLRFDSLAIKEYKNILGDAFNVIAAGYSKNMWLVKFINTGNTYIVKGRYLIDGHVHDSDSDGYALRRKVFNSIASSINYEKTRESQLASASAYQKNNLERTRERNRRAASMRANAEGSHTSAEKDGLLKAQGYKCNCCRHDLTNGKHIDHIMPIVLGGSDFIENIQWLCQLCNNSKAMKHPDEWAIYSASEFYQNRLISRRNTG